MYIASTVSVDFKSLLIRIKLFDGLTDLPRFLSLSMTAF